MTQKQAIQLFEERKVRTVWDDEADKWYVSIVDVIAVLTESKDAAAYWRKLKQRLKAEGNDTVTNCHGLIMTDPDSKMRLTDVADAEQLFRLVQSIPSPKAEPFKLWLSSLARERLEEIDDPEQGIDRMLEYYHRKGYSENWINQRLKSIEVRKELTDEWERRGIKKGQEYATLTDIITLGWSGMTTRQYKQYKGLKTESLRDNMTNLELVLNMLAEATTTEISKERKPRTAAAQLAKALNLPYREGFIKNRYVGRTFIMPGQAVRKKSVRQKLNAMAIEFKDKNVLLVDDSIVRGTTIKEIVRLARQSGAKKVFIASGAPPVRYPNVYGIDMPTTAELIAGDNRPTEQIRIEIGADALVYQTIEGMKEAVGGLTPEIKRFDCSCYDGDYVTGDITPQFIAELEKKRMEAKAEAKKAASED